MALSQDIQDKIKNGEYPHTARTVDPLVVRVNKFTLLVNDTTFYAKVKCGLGFRGYQIYCSSLGTPIEEKGAMYKDQKQSSISGFEPYEQFPNKDTPLDKVKEWLDEKAKEYLDELEKEIADRPSDNSIKRAIDRMCWQLHYDITESHTEFSRVFANDDFSDVEIDRYPMETDYWDGCTLKTTISGIAGVTWTAVEQGGKIEVQVDNPGYLHDSSETLKAFDDHLTIGMYDVGEEGIVTEGALKKLNSSIVSFDESINESLSTLNTTFGTFDSNLNGSSDTSTKKVIDARLDKIATNLKGDNDDFTISVALRESGQYSVSQAINEQTQLESQRFTNIDNILGTPSDSTANTIFGSISVNASSLSGDISDAESTLSGEIGSVGDIAETINDTIGTRASGDRSLMDRIGETSYGLNTIFGETDQIYESMFGKNVGQSGGHYGFVRGPGWVGQDWSNWVATEQ